MKPSVVSPRKFERQIIFAVPVFLLSASAIAGSFWMESQGFEPCPWCLAIRYTFFALLTLSLFSVINPFFFKLILFCSVLGVIFDFPLLKGDLFPSSESGLCEIGGSATECFTPKFAGIFLSVWALFILIFVAICAVGYIIFERKPRGG